MKTFLMATDLSARSERALDRALNLAAEHGAALTVIHVVDADLPASLAEEQAEAARRTIGDHIRKTTGRDAEDITVTVAFGRSHAEILAMAEKTAADLIIVGVHRADAFMDLFRGTTAERVIRAARVPVLLVSEKGDKPYRKIMVGVDFSVYSKRALAFALDFAPRASFHVVHAYDVPFGGFLYGRNKQTEAHRRDQVGFERTKQSEMTAFLAGFETQKPRFKPVLKQGEAQQVISQQASRLNPDLLVIGTHGLTGLAHAFLGSVAEDMLRNPPCDVLTVKAG